MRGHTFRTVAIISEYAVSARSAEFASGVMSDGRGVRGGELTPVRVRLHIFSGASERSLLLERGQLIEIDGPDRALGHGHLDTIAGHVEQIAISYIRRQFAVFP